MDYKEKLGRGITGLHGLQDYMDYINTLKK